MPLATLISCSTRSRSRISCSRRWRVASRTPVLSLHSSTILPPTIRWMTIAFVLISTPIGATQKLPSIVEAAVGETSYHLVPIGCLILDVDTDLGEYGRLLCDRPYEALAAGLLIRLQVVIDEVRGEKLL